MLQSLTKCDMIIFHERSSGGKRGCPSHANILEEVAHKDMRDKKSNGQKGFVITMPYWPPFLKAFSHKSTRTIELWAT